MNAFFEPILEIKGLNAEGPNSLTCLLTISAKKDLPENEFREIKDFLQRLFHVVVKYQGKLVSIAGFSIISEEKEISIDDLERKIRLGEVNLSYLDELNDNVVKISIKGDVSWCHEDIMVKAIKRSFIAHLECLILLGQVLNSVEDSLKDETFNNLHSYLRLVCSEAIDPYNRACSRMVAAENSNTFRNQLASIRDEYIKNGVIPLRLD